MGGALGAETLPLPFTVCLAIIMLKFIMNFSLSIVYMIPNNTNTHKLT